MSSLLKSGACLVAFLSLAVANFTANEIAYWNRPRGSVIRDHVYIEGGWIQTGNWTNGEWDTKSLNTFNPNNGLLFELDLHRPFDNSRDGSPAFFQTIPEYAVTNFYLDGYMFADYNEFYAWGFVASSPVY